MTLTCFKSYDVRGQLGIDLDQSIAYRIGRAYAQVLSPGLVVTGRDVRESSPGLQTALIQGLRDEGVDVIDLQLCGTEEVYFATDHFGAGGGLMVTASHNPISWNGIKLVREGARPMSWESGLKDVHDLADRGKFGPAKPAGALRRENPREAYATRVASYLDPGAVRPLRLLVNAGNGTAGKAFDAIIDKLEAVGAPFDIIRINHDPDSRFPNGIPNPLLPENQPKTAEAVLRTGADLGIAWDGDFDRCFFFDETGAFIAGEYVVALLAQAFLAKEPGARIVHDPRVMWNTIDVVRAGGGVPVICRTGHAHLKAKMREVDAVYGGEISAHHYFRSFMYCDSGMIPWVLLAEVLGRTGKPLSTLIAGMQARFPSSGEINFSGLDNAAALARFEAAYLAGAAAVDRLDGLSVEYATWRANVRISNTEGVLRLNVETRGDQALLGAKVAEISGLLAA